MSSNITWRTNTIKVMKSDRSRNREQKKSTHVHFIFVLRNGWNNQFLYVCLYLCVFDFYESVLLPKVKFCSLKMISTKISLYQCYVISSPWMTDRWLEVQAVWILKFPVCMRSWSWPTPAATSGSACRHGCCHSTCLNGSTKVLPAGWLFWMRSFPSCLLKEALKRSLVW